MAIGAASAVIVTSPNNVKDLVFVGTLAAFAALLPDFDVKSSKGSQLVNRAIMGLTGLWILIFVIDYFLGTGINKRIFAAASGMRVIAEPVAIAGIIVYVANLAMSSHRGFSHSIAASALIALFGFAVFRPLFAQALLIGYVSHIIADLLNKKGVQMFYPFKHRICFNMCRADGAVNDVLFILSVIAIIAFVGMKIFLK